MPLFRHTSWVDDPWLHLADDEPCPAVGMVTVSLARLLGPEGRSLCERDDWLGVRLNPGERVEALLPFLSRLGLVVFTFSRFSDGRGFSEARILRHQLGFLGEIRAAGDIFVDQYAFLLRCGFDSFDVPAAKVKSWQPERVRIPFVYQVDGGDAKAIWRARHERAPGMGG
jgi:uncharacterized protein (DUF934 family)